MSNLFEVACERIERENKNPDMVESIADCLVQDHICLMNECESLRQQLAAAQEEVTLDEQRVADLMGQVGELSNQLASSDAEVAELHRQVTDLQGQVGLLLRTAKALAATDVLKDVILCHAEPSLYLYPPTGKTLHASRIEESRKGTWEPLYRAWEPKP